MTTILPFGSFRSPISAELVTASATRLGDVVVDGRDLVWSESRAAEGGRMTILRRTVDGVTQELVGAPFSARTTVHEYGGGALAASSGAVYFQNFADQRLYRATHGKAPAPITPEGSRRYAAMQVDARRKRLVCVEEDHDGDGEPTNRIVGLSLDGTAERQVLVEGGDFFASPRLHPEGSKLAWLSWNHPDMPWDAAELWLGTLASGGRVVEPRRIAGGAGESVFQPEWGPTGELFFVSDRSGFWNLYRFSGERVDALGPRDAEFGRPQWVFEMSTYAVLGDGRIACAYGEEGRHHLALLNPTNRRLDPVETGHTEIWSVRSFGDRVLFAGASPEENPRLVVLDPETRTTEVLRSFGECPIDARFISRPRAFAFPTTNGKTAHALYYPPKNDDFRAPERERPPLLVKSHGGPTAAASTALNLKTQYYTSRGIAVLDVDYRGSTGYGRAYRKELDGLWGVADVDDCVHGALALAQQGEVDEHRLLISGGSAGGYTTLAALAFRKVFRAGASHYGISDLEALAADTHKFEAKYLERLIGPYPARRELYVERSPIHHVERLSCPVIFFQGLEDKVVPPNQTLRMVEALRAKGIPVSYVPFEAEQHGFRKAENIRRAVEAEIYFFARVLGFELADVISPVAIENLPV